MGAVRPPSAWMLFGKTPVREMLKSDPFQRDLSLCLNTLLPKSWVLPRETPNEGSVFFRAPVTHWLPTREQTGRTLQRANYRRDLPAKSHVLALL